MVFAVVLLVLVSGFAGTATAADELDLTVQTPSDVTAGETAEITAEVSLPDIVGSHSADVALALSVDGDQVESKTVTLSDGESTSASFSPTMDSSGDHTVTIEASVSVGGQSFSQSVSKTVTVTEDVPEPTVTETDVIGGATTDVSGASFATPPSLEDEVASYRDTAPGALAPHTFVVATADSVYLVFSESEPQTGEATVTGTQLEGSIAARGVTFTPIVATETTFSQRGQSASVKDIVSSTDDYRLDLVRVTATHRQATSLTDPDSGNDFTAANTAGVLVEDPVTAGVLGETPGASARSFAINSSTDERGGSPRAVVRSTLNATDPRLYTVNFQTDFWMDASATVDGIVIAPDSEARDFLAAFDRSGYVPDDSTPFLYVVNQNTEATRYDDVSTLQADSADGDLVTVDAMLAGKTLSVQETLEESTGCDATKLKIQTTHGPVCVDVVQDTLVHGGIAWTDVPESKTDSLFVVGLSSRHLDERTETIEGEYELTGEVVSTSRIDPSLPDGKVLVVHDMQRTGDIDYSNLGSNSQEMIQNQSGQLESVLVSQVERGNVESVDPAAEEKTRTGTPTSTPSPGTSSREGDGGGDIVSEVGEVIEGVLDGLLG